MISDEFNVKVIATIERLASHKYHPDCGTTPLGDLIKFKLHSFFWSDNLISAFLLQNVARVAALRLLVVLQDPMSIHF